MATNLPPLEPHTRLSPNVIRILGGNPSKFTLQGTNTYLIGTGATRLLIDTGEGRPVWRSTLAEVLEAEGCGVGSILLTHWHPDHVGGVGDVLSLCPEASVHKFAGGPGAGTQSSTPHVAIPASVAPIRDGEHFDVQGARLTAVHAPGHTTDHTGFVLREESDALFSGDAVLGHGTAVFEDLAAYIRALHRLHGAVGPTARIYPGHGDVIADGKAKLQEYLDHRAQREREIWTVLKDRALANNAAPPACTPMDIVKVIYKAYPVEYHAPAENGVRLVLAKLKEDGTVEENEGAWRLTKQATATL